MALVPQEQWDRVFRELTQRFPSRSPLRHLGEGLVDTMAGFTLNIDSHQHVQLVRLLAGYGHPGTLALLEEVANADPVKFPDRQEDAKLARAILLDLDSAKSTEPAPLPVAPSSSESQQAAADLAQLRAENQRLREDLAAARTEVYQPRGLVEYSTSVVEQESKTTGEVVGHLIDVIEELRLADPLDDATRATLGVAINILEAKKNGVAP